jgi:hypothetical protein
MNFQLGKKNYFFSFKRILVPYCQSVNISKTGINLKIKGKSGIAVYDLDMKKLLEIPFADDFVAEVMDMPSPE